MPQPAQAVHVSEAPYAPLLKSCALTTRNACAFSQQEEIAEMLDEDNFAWGRPSRKQQRRARS